MLPSILAASKTIGKNIVQGSISRKINEVGSSKLSEISLRIKRDAPGEIWNRVGGNQIPIVDALFNRWNEKRISRIDRYNELKELRSARKQQDQKLENSKFVRNQEIKQEKQQKQQERIAQEERAAREKESHVSAQVRAETATRGAAEISFLERISNDIAQLKEYIFKNGLGGRENPLQKLTPQAGNGLFSGILNVLTNLPVFGGGALGSLGRKGIGALKGIGSKAIDFVKFGSSMISNAAKSVAPRIGTFAESIGDIGRSSLNGLRAGAADVISRGSDILSSAKGTISGILRGGGAIGRIAGIAGRFLNPATAVAGAGLTGWEIGNWLNEKMEGTDIGKVKDRIFDNIFAGIDKLTGGMISGSDESWKESDLGKFVDGTKEKLATVTKRALSAVIPSAAAMTSVSHELPLAGPGTIAQPGQVRIPSAFGVDQKADEIRIRAEQQKLQRSEQQKFERIEKTNRDLIDSIDANTKATNDTVEPLKTISDPDWLQKLGEWISGTASKIGGWIKNSEVGQAVSRTYESIKNSEVGKAIEKAGESIKNSGVGQAVSRTYEGVKDWFLGATSKKYESGRGGAGTISSGAGDLGGKSYGTYQMTGDALKKFVTEGPYAEQFKGLELKSAAFDAKWKELAETDPKFGEAQHEFIKKTHFDPQHEHLLNSGIDLTNRGAAVQDAIWSTAVQFGAKTNLIKNALAGKDISKMSDSDIVSAIQDYKIQNNDKLFKSSSEGVRSGTLSRAIKEKEDLLALAKNSNLGEDIQLASAGTLSRANDLNKLEAVTSSGAGKLSSATLANIGDIVGEQTIETKNAEQKAVQPIIISSAGQTSAPVPVQQGGTTNTGSAPMVTRNQDSSIRRITDGMMSYGFS
jgi:hypothetical protein